MVKAHNKNKKSQLRIKLHIVDHDPNEGIPFKQQIKGEQDEEEPEGK
jgi:hypothetical protein